MVIFHSYVSLPEGNYMLVFLSDDDNDNDDGDDDGVWFVNYYPGLDGLDSQPNEKCGPETPRPKPWEPMRTVRGLYI